MTDQNLAKAIRAAVAAINEYDEGSTPLWNAYEQAVQEAKDAGLQVREQRAEMGDALPQPKIYRELIT